MDKMTHTKFNLNNFLFAISEPLDTLISANQHNTPYCSKRVAYIALKIAKLNEIDPSIISDLFSYSIIQHNNFLLQNRDRFPFNDITNIQTQMLQSILSLSLFVEGHLNIKNNYILNRNKIIDILEKEESFDEILKENLLYLMEFDNFWFDLTNTTKLPLLLLAMIDDFTLEYPFEKLIALSDVFYNLSYQIHNKNYKESIANKITRVASFYNFDNKDISRLILCGNFASIGSFVSSIPCNDIALQAYYTKDILSNIFGFDDIAEIASSFGENLDGSGYPYKQEAHTLSLKHRIFIIIYRIQVLEDREKTNKEIFEILYQEAQNGLLDKSVLKDILSLMHT